MIGFGIFYLSQAFGKLNHGLLKVGILTCFSPSSKAEVTPLQPYKGTGRERKRTVSTPLMNKHEIVKSLRTNPTILYLSFGRINQRLLSSNRAEDPQPNRSTFCSDGLEKRLLWEWTNGDPMNFHTFLIRSPPLSPPPLQRAAPEHPCSRSVDSRVGFAVATGQFRIHPGSGCLRTSS